MMEFSPNNPIVKLCLQGMAMEEQGKPEEADSCFSQAWAEADNDFEKYLAAFYMAQHRDDPSDRLRWLETSLQYALRVNDESVKGAYRRLYADIAQCYIQLNDPDDALRNQKLADACDDAPTDKGPFYHGTKADLKVGDSLTPGRESNYQSGLIMRHIYFTALVNGAGLAAALAKGEGRERVYLVEPTGSFENDPNVTNKKFPGNPTRSYRTSAPLRILAEIADWDRQTPGQIREWRAKLEKNNGEIVN